MNHAEDVEAGDGSDELAGLDYRKSAETLIHNLVDIAAKGGNYLLNVGPPAEGIIPAPSISSHPL